jgi:hypothetical protein
VFGGDFDEFAVYDAAGPVAAERVDDGAGGDDCGYLDERDVLARGDYFGMVECAA